MVSLLSVNFLHESRQVTCLHIGNNNYKLFLKIINCSSVEHLILQPGQVCVFQLVIRFHLFHSRRVLHPLHKMLISPFVILPVCNALISFLWLSVCSSDYDDWRPALASLLQPIPFPKE